MRTNITIVTESSVCVFEHVYIRIYKYEGRIHISRGSESFDRFLRVVGCVEGELWREHSNRVIRGW